MKQYIPGLFGSFCSDTTSFDVCSPLPLLVVEVAFDAALVEVAFNAVLWVLAPTLRVAVLGAAPAVSSPSSPTVFAFAADLVFRRVTGADAEAEAGADAEAEAGVEAVLRPPPRAFGAMIRDRGMKWDSN